jgi:uncharacterized protein (DUF58 family)
VEQGTGNEVLRIKKLEKKTGTLMFRRCRFTVPQTTWAYVAILVVVVVGAMMREINLLIILAGLMAGPLLMSWQLIRLTLRRIQVTRRFPRGVFPGQTFVVEFIVHNPRERLDSWGLVIQDRLRNVLAGQPTGTRTARCLVPHVAAGSSRTACYRARLWQRGRYRFGPVTLSTKVPVGLLQGDVTIKETADLLVFPRLGRLNAGWSELVKFHQLGQRSWRRNQGPVEGDFYGLRDWRPGDSRRWIHWRSSAKRQDLVVRQFEQHHSQDLVVLLDLGESPQANERARQTAELTEKAISFVATVVADFCQRGGGRLTMAIASQSPRLVRGAASSALLGDTLELLAEAMATPQDMLPNVLIEALSGTSPGDRVIIVSTRPIDLLDSHRFPGTSAGNVRRANLHEAICLDVSRANFVQLFDWSDTEQCRASEVAQWQR